jgi:hypothetical protein
VPSAHASSPPYNELVPGYFEPLEEESSAGISSSASEKKPDKNGSSGTLDLPSPAPSAESPSEPDPAQQSALSSSVSLTAGSTQETTSSQPGPQASSEVEGLEVEPTPEAVKTAGEDIMAAARTAYEDKDYATAVTLLEQARTADPTLSLEVARALTAVAEAQA